MHAESSARCAPEPALPHTPIDLIGRMGMVQGMDMEQRLSYQSVVHDRSGAQGWQFGRKHGPNRLSARLPHELPGPAVAVRASGSGGQVFTPLTRQEAVLKAMYDSMDQCASIRQNQCRTAMDACAELEVARAARPSTPAGWYVSVRTGTGADTDAAHPCINGSWSDGQGFSAKCVHRSGDPTWSMERPATLPSCSYMPVGTGTSVSTGTGAVHTCINGTWGDVPVGQGCRGRWVHPYGEPTWSVVRPAVAPSPALDACSATGVASSAQFEPPVRGAEGTERACDARGDEDAGGECGTGSADVESADTVGDDDAGIAGCAAAAATAAAVTAESAAKRGGAGVFVTAPEAAPVTVHRRDKFIAASDADSSSAASVGGATGADVAGAAAGAVLPLHAESGAAGYRHTTGASAHQSASGCGSFTPAGTNVHGPWQDNSGARAPAHQNLQVFPLEMFSIEKNRPSVVHIREQLIVDDGGAAETVAGSLPSVVHIREQLIADDGGDPDPSPRLDDYYDDGTGAGSIRRKAWSLEEDTAILESVQQFGARWRVIAAMLPGRSDDAVRNRWNRLQEQMREGTNHEPTDSMGGADVYVHIPTGEKRKEGYKCSKCGQPKRNHVCTRPDMPTATAKRNAVLARDEAADKVRVSWSREEDMTIRSCVQRVGPRWSLIAQELRGRTEHAVRNRWHRLQTMDEDEA